MVAKKLFLKKVNEEMIWRVYIFFKIDDTIGDNNFFNFAFTFNMCCLVEKI